MTRARDLAAFVSNADGDIKFDTDTLFIDSSANRVGIGVTDPSAMLEIKNSTASNQSGQIRVNNDNDIGASVGVFGSTASTFGAYQANSVFIGTSGTATELLLNNPNASGKIRFATGASGGTERMRINSSGNVHITDNANGPDAALHIEKTTPQVRLQLNGNSGYNTIESGGSNELIIGRSGTEQLRVLSGGGLTFNGDTAAANALNDYEEGSWSPKWVNTSNQDIFDTGPTVNMARYTKIGDVVIASAYFNNPGSGFGNTGNYNATAGVNIGGLPFTSTGSGASDFYAGSVGWHDNWLGYSGGTPMIYTANNSTRAALVYTNGSNISPVKQQEVDNTGSGIIFTITYKTSQ